MKVVLDTNIIISALLRDSVTRKLIIDAEADFYYPRISFDELKKYKELLQTKSGLDTVSLDILIDSIFKKIQIVEKKGISGYFGKARMLIEKRDPDDVVFLALALSLKEAIIWSDDKDLKSQNEIRVYSTNEIKNIF